MHVTGEGQRSRQQRDAILLSAFIFMAEKDNSLVADTAGDPLGPTFLAPRIFLVVHFSKRDEVFWE